MVREIDFSEIPIMFVNLSGDLGLDKIKKYAEMAQDKIEALKEITRVDIVGALDREIQIDVDMYKLQVAGLTFGDIERAVKFENMTVAGGTIEMQGMRRSVRVVGEFKNIDEVKNIIVGSATGAQVKLSEVAQVRDDFKEQESYARLNGKNVITLNIIKKSGENLIVSSDKIKDIMADFQKTKFPKELNVVITGDQSHKTKTTLNDLNNTIIIGFLLVTLVLMFFMGLTNAIFVGLSIPLAIALSYIVLPGIGFTMNMLVMFAFIFALGIVVDDAIVVIENTHRIFKQNRNLTIAQSAKYAAGEMFVPILSGTLTTLAPFFPLAFWPGIVGKFMFFIPVTLIIALFSSLIVAYLLNPVFAVTFMKHEDDDENHQYKKKTLIMVPSIIGGFAFILHLAGSHGLANFLIFVAISYIAHNIFGYKLILRFQNQIWPKALRGYEKTLRWVLKGYRPVWMMLSLILLLIATFIITAKAKPKVVFFPDNEPQVVMVYISLPVGTDIKVTDSVTRIVEKQVTDACGVNNKIVESVIANVAMGASDNQFDSGTKTSNKGKITVNFVDFEKRNGESTNAYMEKIRAAVKGIPGAVISVEKQRNGPPTGKPINIEVTGDNLEEMATVTDNLKKYIKASGIQGIAELKSDFDARKPELIIKIDRQRAQKEGLSSGQIGAEIRTAILGKEVTKYRDGEDQYPVDLRYSKYEREDIERLMNLKIIFRDMSMGGIVREIPLSSVATIEYQNTYSGITRNNAKRVITLYSDVITGYSASEINPKLEKAFKHFQKPEGIDLKITGENESQQESADFLGKSMLLSILFIIFILVTQFNSTRKPLIIVSEILFSIIGVLLGFVIFHMSISIIMTGMGIVALAGIVVRNGILLVECTDVLLEQGMELKEGIIEAAKRRITPVVLTSTATILGLIPLAVGFNIDFISLFQHLDPKIHFGGDSVTFFGALAWTITFGLSFATFITLVMVPVMYLLVDKLKIKTLRLFKKNKE
jgi:multidrug efflux pump subunit AcrB